MSVVIKKEMEGSIEQFINGISNEEMMIEIIREFNAIKETNEVTSEQTMLYQKSRGTKSTKDNIWGSQRPKNLKNLML